MNEVVIPYNPRPLQKTIHDELKRWNVLVCHRRFGKTVAMINQLIKDALTNKLQRPRYAYLCPLRTQAKSVAWDYLKHFSRPIPGVTFNEAELRADYPNEGRVQLFGCDNPDSLRGQYFDGVIFDEYAQMAPNVFTEIIRPALSDRKGYAIFIGTPKGKNAFFDLYQHALNDDNWLVELYRASETGIVDEDELKDAQNIMDKDEYHQEYECSWAAAIKGAYYGRQLQRAEDGKRIGPVPYDENVSVSTAWDLGIGDATAIWFFQQVGQEIHLIDYYEASGEALSHYAKILQKKPYIWGVHLVPHDAEARELGTGKSRREVLKELGIKTHVIPQSRIQDGIQQVRGIFSRIWIDRDKCKQGLDALWHYHKEYDDKRQTFRQIPYHDWSSHGSDAFRYLAMGIKNAGQRKFKQLDYSQQERMIV